MTTRDERRARLQKRCDKHQNQWGGASGVLVVLDDLRAELKASNRDRKALAEARAIIDTYREGEGRPPMKWPTDD